MAFFRFLNADRDSVFNLMPLQYIGTKDDVDLQLGEPVYKIGRSIGLTIGKLGSVEYTFRSHGSQRYGRFAFSMDCGSLYCVKRGPMFVPIAIHRISDTNISYGCSIWNPMEFFLESGEELANWNL